MIDDRFVDVCVTAPFPRHADVKSLAEQFLLLELQICPRRSSNRLDDVSPGAILVELDSIDGARLGQFVIGRLVLLIRIRRLL